MGIDPHLKGIGSRLVRGFHVKAAHLESDPDVASSQACRVGPGGFSVSVECAGARKSTSGIQTPQGLAAQGSKEGRLRWVKR